MTETENDQHSKYAKLYTFIFFKIIHEKQSNYIFFSFQAIQNVLHQKITLISVCKTWANEDVQFRASGSLENEAIQLATVQDENKGFRECE